MENFQFIYQNHGLTPLEKCQFFDFFKLLDLTERIENFA